MRTETIALPAVNHGAAHSLTVQRFGEPGARPQVYVQASLHADEIPGMICAVHLRRMLLAHEAAGKIRGEIILVPVANPLGLGQTVFGHAMGRFSLADGGNYNREFPHLTPGAAKRLDGRLGSDATANVAVIRTALAEELEAWSAPTQAAALKKELVRLAIGADLVLDLHCDAEGALHLYTQPTSAEIFAPFGAWLGSKATLTAEVSGGDPFDEVLSRPWIELRARFPQADVPLACHSVTVELRGQADISHAFAEADAAAIFAFLQHAGALAGAPPARAAGEQKATPLESSEPLIAPVAGIVVFRMEAGAMVTKGDAVVDIVDPISGDIVTVSAQSSGVLFARNSSRFASPGKRLGKIAGTELRRTGKLLSL
jgi:predicted deacylase